MPIKHENSAMRPEPKLDYIECIFGIISTWDYQYGALHLACFFSPSFF